MKTSDKHLTILLLAGGCLFSSGLLAQDAGDELMSMEEAEQAPKLYTSEIEIGASYVSEDSYKFGEYSGMKDEGGYAVGNLKIRKYIAPDSNDKTYWELNGVNLGLDSRSVSGEYSESGLFRLTFNYDQIPHNRFNDGSTPFIGAGTTDQTLPSSWVGASSTSGLTDLLPSLHAVGVHTERKRYGGGFSWNFTDRWQLSGMYRHENKDGRDTLGAAFGTTGGDPRSSILVRPIDYQMDDFNVGIAYTGDTGQYSLNYHLSLFNNKDNSLTWDNPFNNASSWDPGANFSDGARGRMSSEPDNQAWQINFAGGYDLGQMTRLTANVSYGEMTQDQSFLPYSSVFPAAVPLPQSNLDGQIDTVFVNLGLYTRLTRKLSLTGRYTYDDRDNQTPLALYQPVPQDSAAQDPFLDEGSSLNHPYSLRRHKVDVEGNYNLMMSSRLSLGYEYETVHRDYTEVEDTREHTGKIRLTYHPFSSAGGWIRYRHSARRGSSYVSNRPFLTGHTQAFIDATAPDDLYINDPLMRKFHIADRDRDQVAAAVSYTPSDVVTFTVSGQYNSDDFTNTQDGLQKSRNGSVTFDAGYTPSNKVSFNAYVTYENYDYKQRGFHHNGFQGALTPTTDRIAVFGDQWWTIDSEDKIYSGGASMDWTVIEDKFNVKADFVASHARTKLTPFSTGISYLPIPDVKTDMYRFTLDGEYKYRENMGLRVRYLYESYDTSDLALDLVTSNTLSNVILLGNGAHNYNDHVIAVSWFYNWQ